MTDTVAILPSDPDRGLLIEIFRDFELRLRVFKSLRCARAPLRRSRAGVVLTDCHLPDGEWKDVLYVAGRKLTNPPLVIVASRLADERLWAEVLNLGGYDVLSMPFHADEVRWSIRSAYRHWRDNCRLSGDEVAAKASSQIPATFPSRSRGAG